MQEGTECPDCGLLYDDAEQHRRWHEGAHQHAIGEPCDICDGRGFDYLGRTCRRYSGSR